DQAIELYQQEQAKLGLANVLLMQGILLLSENQPEQALSVYAQALPLYQAEQDPTGLAYTLAEIIRCQQRLGHLEELEQLAVAALQAASASNTPPVVQYVLRALYEACDEDEAKLQAFLTALEASSTA
ncbi:hypothetical protein VSS37_10245, partial [Candidatus Thiothrix sp. Deng01]